MSPTNPNAPAIYQAQPAAMFTATSSIFDNLDKLAQYEQLAERLSKSNLVPAMYRNKPDECFIALEYAANMGIRPLMAMQNLSVVEGKPSWDGKFVGSVITACGRFRNVRYVMGNLGKIKVKITTWNGVEDREVDNLTCYVEAVEVASGETVKGTTISIAMAAGEGWLGKKGSKWQTMPEQMIQYRAASFFGRVHVQDILFGMYTADEAAEIASQDAGTGAVEIMEGVTGDAPRGRQRRQAVAAPVVAEAAQVVGETVVGEYVSSEPVAEAITAPVPAAPAPAVVQPAPAAAAPVQPAPVANPAPTVTKAQPGDAEGNFTIQPRHIAVLLKIQKDPLAVNLSEEERKAIKEFGSAYPDFVELPKRMGKKTELVVSPEGLEFLGSDPAAVAAYDALLASSAPAGSQDPGDMGEPPVAEMAQMTNEPAGPSILNAEFNSAMQPIDPAATATMQVLRDPQPTPQQVRDAKQAEQYPATPAPTAAAPKMLGPDSQGGYHAAGSQGAFAAWPPSGDPEQYKRDNAPAGSTAEAAPEGDSVSDLFDLPR